MKAIASQITWGQRIGAILAWKRTVWWILATAVAVRLILLFLLADDSLRNDQKSYHAVALQVVHGERYSPDWPPGLPYSLAAFHVLLGSSEFSSRIAALTFGLGLLWLFHRIAYRMVSLRSANALLLVFAFSPTFIFHSFEPLTQVPTALCLLAVAGLLGGTACPSRGKLAVLGVILAAMVLFRPASLLVAVFAVAFLSMRWKSASVAILPVLIAGTVIAAWLWKAHSLTGHWIPINRYNSANLFYGNNPHTPLYRTWWLGSHGPGEEGVPATYTRLISSIDSLPPEDRDIRFRVEAVQHILGRPDLFLIRSLSRIRSFFAFDTFVGSFMYKWYGLPRIAGLASIAIDAALYVALFMIALTVLLFRARDVLGRNVRVLLLGLVLCYALPYWISFAHPAYHVPVIPLIALLAGAGMEQLFVAGPGAWLRQLTPRRRAVLIATVSVFLAIQVEWIVMMIGRM